MKRKFFCALLAVALLVGLLSGCGNDDSPESSKTTVPDPATLPLGNRASGEDAEGPWFINRGGQFDYFIHAILSELPKELYTSIQQGENPKNGKLWADYTMDIVEIGGKTCVEFVVGLYHDGKYSEENYYALDAVGDVYRFDPDQMQWKVVYKTNTDYLAFVRHDENTSVTEHKLRIDKVHLVHEDDQWAAWQFGLTESDFIHGEAVVNEEVHWESLPIPSESLFSIYYDMGGEMQESLLMFDEFTSELSKRPDGCMLVRIIEYEISLSITEIPLHQSTDDQYISGTGTAVSNNGGLYVKYGGKIYCRLYDKNDYEPSVSESLNSPALNKPSNMMELGADGSKEVLFPDDGFGEIFIQQTQSGACFILNRMGQEYNSAEEYDFEPEIYGVSLDGTERHDFGRGVIFAVDDARGLIIAIRTGDGICTIDTGSGEAIYLTAGDHAPLYYDAENGALYCADTQGSGWENPALCVIDIDTGEETILFSLEKEAMDTLCGDLSIWYEYRNLCLLGDYMRVYLAGYDGYSEEPTGSALLQIGPDGFWAEIEAHPSDWFGIREPFSHESGNPLFDRLTYVNYLDYGGGIYMYDGNMEERILLSTADMSMLGISYLEYYGEEDFCLVTDAEYVDESFFFTVISGLRDRTEDADWGYGYIIQQSTVYHKDLLTGEITLLNVF